MDIQARIPHKALLAWCEKNAEKIDVLDHYYGGWCDDRGNSVARYEVVLADGWHLDNGGPHKIISDTSGSALLKELKCITQCTAECKQRQ